MASVKFGFLLHLARGPQWDPRTAALRYTFYCVVSKETSAPLELALFNDSILPHAITAPATPSSTHYLQTYHLFHLIALHSFP